MAANIFGRYVWLVEQFLYYGRLTYEEVNELWCRSGLSYGKGDNLPIRTFHNHRKAIADIFDIDIACDPKDGYRYYISNSEDLENDDLRRWLLDSYSVLNHVHADRKLKDRILLEHLPSGYKWLNVIADAMRNNRVVHVTYKGFGKMEASDFDIEPYFLKVVKRRWYVLARNPYYSELNRTENRKDGGERKENVYMLYALDRITECQQTGTSFKFEEGLDVTSYFGHDYGIIHTEEEPVRIVLRAYYNAPHYLRSLPLHESQCELNIKDDKSAYFELRVVPTFDFYQALLAQADQIEVLEPEFVRLQMKSFAEKILSYYHDSKDLL